jgi:hypothetical protein
MRGDEHRLSAKYSTSDESDASASRARLSGAVNVHMRASGRRQILSPSFVAPVGTITTMDMFAGSRVEVPDGSTRSSCARSTTAPSARVTPLAVVMIGFATPTVYVLSCRCGRLTCIRPVAIARAAALSSAGVSALFPTAPMT